MLANPPYSKVLAALPTVSLFKVVLRGCQFNLYQELKEAVYSLLVSRWISFFSAHKEIIALMEQVRLKQRELS